MFDHNCHHLALASVDNGGSLVVLDRARRRARSFERLDNGHTIGISNLAEDDVPIIKPRRDDRGDEELRAVAISRCVLVKSLHLPRNAGATHVFGPALAMERRPGLVCFMTNFSSLNFAP